MSNAQINPYAQIDYLETENASLRAEVERLRMALADTEALELGTAERCKRWRESYKMQEQQLAISQLEAKRLRESVDQYLIENDPSDFGCACDLSVGHLCGPCFAHKQQTVLRQALSSSTSTETLDAYVAEKVKSARVIDEKQIAYLLEERSVFTRQRDLAVSALKTCLPVYKSGLKGYYPDDQKIHEVLAAIKESESPNKP